MNVNHTIRLLFFISVFILCTIELNAQRISVTDKQGQPIENVVVIGDDFTSHTDSTGYLLFFPENGSRSLLLIHPSYQRRQIGWDELVSNDFVVIMNQQLRQLGEITVNAMRREQTADELSQKIDVISPAQYQLYQAQTSADLLQHSGEVFIQKSQMGGGSPMIRGFSANRIVLVVDGIRMNNAIYRSGNLHNVLALDASALEQSEVIYGPGSVIYGSDALGGVIHFHTLKPLLSTRAFNTSGQMMTRFSSANFEKTAHLDLTLSGKKWASSTSFTFSDFDDLFMGKRQNDDYLRKHYVVSIQGIDSTVVNPQPEKQVASGYSQLNLIQKIRYRPSEQADFEYAFHYSGSSDIPRYDRLLQYSGEELKYAQWYYGPQQWMMHSVKGEFTPTSALFNQLTVLAAIQDYTESRHDRRFGQSTLNSRREHVDIVSLNVDATKFFAGDHSLFYGFEGIFNKIHSAGSALDITSGTAEALAPRYPDNSEWWSLAAYLSYKQLLGERTSMQAGARYNLTGMRGVFDRQFYSFPFEKFENSDGATTVNFGMVFNPWPALRFNLNTATGFRAPNIDDAAKVFDSEPGSVIVPNPELEPEYASSFEAGSRWQISQGLSAGITMFYTRLFNAMVRRGGTLNGSDSLLYDGEMSRINMLTNASWANIGGISAHASYQLLSRFTLKGNINWQSGSDSDGEPLRHVAPLFADVHAIAKTGSCELDLYVLANGPISYEKLAPDERDKTYMYARDENGNPYSPSWWTLNLKGRYVFSDFLALSAGIENLLNVRYRPYSSGIVAPGLNAIISLNIKW
ncbi:TonB-dependent receptor [Roseimarinus sediminis]|uniref:TonB-dependent receptor n=1 Tax=Roseimarinus sediminis TaxID=1610899 RepID=UPI003D1E3FE9